MTIAPASLLEHRRDGRARRPQRGEEVDLQRRLEVGVAGREESVEAQVHRADVVDEHVDAAVALDRVGDEPFGPAGLREVDLQRR